MADSAQKLKQSARHLREMAKSRLDEARRALAKVRVERVAALATIRTACHAAKLELRDRRKRLLEAIALERVELKKRCKLERAAIVAGFKDRRERAAKLLEQERTRQREERELAARWETARGTTKRRGAEAIRESDDAVEAELSPDLIPVWRAVKHRIKGSKRISRAEAFLHWAHEHPGEVLERQERHAAVTLAAQQRAEREYYAAQKAAKRSTAAHERDVKRATRDALKLVIAHGLAFVERFDFAPRFQLGQGADGWSVYDDQGKKIATVPTEHAARHVIAEADRKLAGKRAKGMRSHTRKRAPVYSAVALGKLRDQLTKAHAAWVNRQRRPGEVGAAWEKRHDAIEKRYRDLEAKVREYERGYEQQTQRVRESAALEDAPF